MKKVEKDFNKLFEMAKDLEDRGIGSIEFESGWSNEITFTITWTIETGDDFIRASAFAHEVDRWSDYIDYDDIDWTCIYSAEDDENEIVYMIKIACVWL